jgi:molecular chaperone Hsp33
VSTEINPTPNTELHRFLFEELAVRGAIVRLGAPWQEVLRRRAANPNTGAYAPAVNKLLGEMAAAAVLMQSNIKFNGALVLQIMGDGPVKLAVAEATAQQLGDAQNIQFRCTATVQGEVADTANLADMVNVLNLGKCAITLDPRDRKPGQQPYQGVVPLHGDQREKLTQIAQVLEHYMLQSEQLETKLVLAANDQVAAGILVQRMPTEGEKNLGERESNIGNNADFDHVAALTASLKPDELLSLDCMELLHRLFWNDKLLRHAPEHPRFACTCSRERVAGMLRGLGAAEVESVIAEQGSVSVDCEFCGAHYAFDAVDAAAALRLAVDQPPDQSLSQH